MIKTQTESPLKRGGSKPLVKSDASRLTNTLSGRLRVKLNLSQVGFAELLQNRTGLDGIPAPNTVWRWERGTPPNAHHQKELEKLAREIGLNAVE